MRTRTRNFSLVLADEMRTRLEIVARNEGRTLSNLINRILSIYLENEDAAADPAMPGVGTFHQNGSVVSKGYGFAGGGGRSGGGFGRRENTVRPSPSPNIENGTGAPHGATGAGALSLVDVEGSCRVINATCAPVSHIEIGAAATAPPVVADAVQGRSIVPQEGTVSASTTEFAAALQPLFLGETGHSSSTPVA
jgi:hypothetical protein